MMVLVTYDGIGMNGIIVLDNRSLEIFYAFISRALFKLKNRVYRLKFPALATSK